MGNLPRFFYTAFYYYDHHFCRDTVKGDPIPKLNALAFPKVGLWVYRKNRNHELSDEGQKRVLERIAQYARDCKRQKINLECQWIMLKMLMRTRSIWVGKYQHFERLINTIILILAKVFKHVRIPFAPALIDLKRWPDVSTLKEMQKSHRFLYVSI